MIYIIADHYQQVKDYITWNDLNPAEVRFLNRPEVLKGVESLEVVVLGDGASVTDALVDALARKGARLSYAELPTAAF